MTPTASVEFAGLLRSHRLKSSISQETLAERAGLSVDAIGAYERGLRTSPRRYTIAQLTDALQLRGKEREEFELAARRKLSPTASTESGGIHNLPWQPTSFIGRHREILDISALLAPRQLVTITGSGGIGKTRTALEVASRFPVPRHGLRFIDLTPVTESRLLLAKIASVLELKLPERGDLLDAVLASIKTLAIILIFDNCEHVIASVRRVVAAIVSACPNVTLLATSRERLGLAGERVYRLSPLSAPKKVITTAAEGKSYDALELLVERATEADCGFGFSDEHVEIAADICRKLNGIPLAIELAAARLPLLGFSELRSQLTKRFQVIDGKHHGSPARQRTVYAAIAWSHNLLDETERVLFRRLAVFTNSWSIDAAEKICGGGVIETASVLDTLFSLVEKSLVNVDVDAPRPRYSFFESTRAYAMEHLAASGEGPALSRLHADWIATLADRPYGTYNPRWRWEATIAPDLDNAIAALEWALAPSGDAVIAGRIASGIRGFWLTGGLALHGKHYVETALKRISSAEHPALVARLLYAQFYFLIGADRIAPMKQAVSLLEQPGDQRLLAQCCLALSFALTQAGQYTQAEDASTKASDIMRREGLQQSSQFSSVLCNLSGLLLRQSRVHEAKTIALEALAIAEQLGDEWCAAQHLSMLAGVEFATGDSQRAIALGEESLEKLRRLGNVTHEANLLCNLACFHIVRGDIDASITNAREALKLAPVTSNAYVHESLQHLATAAALRGKPSHAARLLGFVHACRERMGYRRNPSLDQKSYDILMESLRRQLPEDEISAHAALGAQLTEAAAIDEARVHFASSAVSSSRKLSMSRNER